MSEFYSIQIDRNQISAGYIDQDSANHKWQKDTFCTTGELSGIILDFLPFPHTKWLARCQMAYALLCIAHIG